MPSAAKVPKNAVQTCGLKICPRPVHCALLLLRPTRTRQGENHPKCGIDLLLSPLPLKTQNAGVRGPTVLGDYQIAHLPPTAASVGAALRAAQI